MHLKVLDNQGIIHQPANGSDDVGYDIVAQDYPEIVGNIYQGPYYSFISHLVYKTEIYLEPDSDYYMLLYPRSSIIKTNLVLANSVGVIDPGYRGEIKVCFKYISQPEDQKIVEGKTVGGAKAKGIVTSINPQRIYHEGDKIAQLVPTKINPLTIKKVNQLSETKRSDGGFGSTGK